MEMEVISLKCPNCNAGVDTSMAMCPACDKPIMFKRAEDALPMAMPVINKYLGSYRNIVPHCPENRDINIAIGICFLRMKMYDKALEAFEKAMPDNFDNAEPFYLAAITLLQGKKPFLAQRESINKMEEYLNAATMIEMRPVFYYFMAYIKRDYFKRKYLNTSPTEEDLMRQAIELGLKDEECNVFNDLIGFSIS